MWDDRASDARRHRSSMRQPQMRARWPAQTSHRIRYAHRQLNSVEKILSGAGTLIAAPQTHQDLNRTILGTRSTIDLLTDVFARVRML
mmetsp:Transcript_42622/g.124919  ORF Transcript_42622/g.124919 Transcript_42622/m.124919 type:complete len:88 (-) Transcript_42622:36-299(-)